MKLTLDEIAARAWEMVRAGRAPSERTPSDAAQAMTASVRCGGSSAWLA